MAKFWPSGRSALSRLFSVPPEIARGWSRPSPALAEAATDTVASEIDNPAAHTRGSSRVGNESRQHRRRHHQVGIASQAWHRPRDCSGGGGGRVDSVEPDVDSGVRRIRRHCSSTAFSVRRCSDATGSTTNRESHLYAGSSRAGICGLYWSESVLPRREGSQ